MTLAKKSVAKSITLTDCHPKVLNFLSLNARLNFSNVSIFPTLSTVLDFCFKCGIGKIFQEVQESGDFTQWLKEPPAFVSESACETFKENFTDSNTGLDVRIQHLDWTNFDDRDLPKTDLIIGSDLVYSPCLIPGNKQD